MVTVIVVGLEWKCNHFPRVLGGGRAKGLQKVATFYDSDSTTCAVERKHIFVGE